MDTGESDSLRGVNDTIEVFSNVNPGTVPLRSFNYRATCTNKTNKIMFCLYILISTIFVRNFCEVMFCFYTLISTIFVRNICEVMFCFYTLISTIFVRNICEVMFCLYILISTIFVRNFCKVIFCFWCCTCKLLHKN